MAAPKESSPVPRTIRPEGITGKDRVKARVGPSALAYIDLAGRTKPRLPSDKWDLRVAVTLEQWREWA